VPCRTASQAKRRPTMSASERERLKAHLAKTSAASWKDPETRANRLAKMGPAISAAFNAPGRRERASALAKAQWQDPDIRSRNVASMTATMRSPERRARCAARPCRKCGRPRLSTNAGHPRCGPCHAKAERERKQAKRQAVLDAAE
jgi:hypothetical protein